MTYQYVFSPLAFIEYKDAIVWYKERNERVAIDFVNAVKQKILQIL